MQGLQVALLGGTVAESWDALLNRAPRDGSPVRLANRSGGAGAG